MTTIAHLHDWMGRDLSPGPGQLRQYIQTKPGTAEGSFIFSIFTDGHEFLIEAREPSASEPDGHLGCDLIRRMPDAGEHWRRGQWGDDFSRGPLTYETWVKILGYIVGNEMVPLAKPLMPPDSSQVRVDMQKPAPKR